MAMTAPRMIVVGRRTGTDRRRRPFADVRRYTRS